jgi:glutaredoxin-related protein
MTTIIKDVIESMIEQGYLVNYIIGTKEQIGFPDATVMMFELPTYRLAPDHRVKEYDLTYVISQPSTQQSNDIQTASEQIRYCEKINNLFLDKMMAWQNEHGQQLVQVLENINVREFMDFTVLQHPATGLYCTMKILVMTDVHCTWKN